MSKVKIICAQCGSEAMKEAGGVNRSLGKGARVFCSRECVHEARRLHRSLDESKAIKAAYDREYRDRASVRAKKRAAYHNAVAADPVGMRAKEREIRNQNMARHVEYCRRPEYRAKKHEYDIRRGANQRYGPFADAFLVLRDLEAQIASRATWLERAHEKGTINKTQRRKREYGKAVGC